MTEIVEQEEQNKVVVNNIPENFKDSEYESIDKYVEDSYLDYAMYVILDRALPNIGDGLKPVHRRILYAMSELKLEPSAKYKKSARTIGDVLGKYHPHGDSACYEAMVILAQSFSTRHPLVDGQGNWGSIDDPSSFAAMRYTESKLTTYSGLLLDEVDKKIVDWSQNFDGTLLEPVVLPSRLPNVLINGSSGIAVGLATDILPHNINEVGQACLRLIDDKEATTDDIMEYIEGPDFPTGGEIITSKEDIIQIYKEGKGSIKVRARYKIEDNNIVFYDLPYKTSTSKVIEKIAEQIKNKKMPLIEDVFDESDQNDPVRIVVTPKKKVNRTLLLQHLFATTPLEQGIKVNMNAINLKGAPEHYDIRELLVQWLDFRRQCIYRRTQALLEHTQNRLHILEAYEKVFDAIDMVIGIIRNSDNPFEELKEKLDLTDVQAKHILDIRLRSLAKLEQTKIIEEKEKLLDRESFCLSVIEHPEILDSIMRDEIVADIKKFSDERRSSFSKETFVAKEIDETEFLPTEKITTIISQKGWIRAGKGELDGNSLIYKSGDGFLDSAFGLSNNIITIFDNSGKIYNMNYNDLPNARGYGEPISTKANINGNSIIYVSMIKEKSKYLYVNNKGYGFIVNGNSFFTRQKNGKKIFTLSDNETYFKPVEIKDETVVAILSKSGKLIAFNLDEIKELDKGKGVQLMKLLPEDEISDFVILNDVDTIAYDKESKVDISTIKGVRGRKGKNIVSDVNTFKKIKEERDNEAIEETE